MSQDWDGCEFELFEPTKRQKTIIAAVQSALNADFFYARDVLKHCVDFLGVTPEQALVGADHVEGGAFGMDCYFARRFIDATKRRAQERSALHYLNPQVGQKLGTLVFSNYKRNTGMVIISVSDDRKSIAIKGRRGLLNVSTVCNALGIINAAKLAAGCGVRKKDLCNLAAWGG